MTRSPTSTSASSIAFHQEKGALVTVCLTRVPDPLEFGITIVDEEGRVERFLEKPTWGQVFSDTVNTGIYVMEPEVFDYVEAGQSVDWSGDVFPQLLKEGKPVYGYVAEGYWEDVGTHESYVKAQADVLERPGRRRDRRLRDVARRLGRRGRRGRPGRRAARARCTSATTPRSRPASSCASTPWSARNVVVKSGAFLHRAVVHDNVYIGPQTNLRGCVIGKNTDVMRAARIEDGAVVGDECLIEEESIIAGGVRVYPFKTIEAGAVVNTDGHLGVARPGARCSAPRGVSRRDERRDHAGARRAARRGLRHHAEEGRHGHDRA